MKSIIDLRRNWFGRTAMAILAGSLACNAVAQEEAAVEKTADNRAENNDEKENEKPDPFAVPEGTPAELLVYIRTVSRIRVKSVAEMKKRTAAILTACERIGDSDTADEKLLARVVTEKFSALTALSRYDKKTRAELKTFAETMVNDPRPAIAKIAAGEILKGKAADTGKMSADEQSQLVDELFAFLDKYGLDASSYSAASRIGRSLGYSETPEHGAVLYERLAKLMESSDDERLQSRAIKALGSARRLRLPGNFMDVMGTTGEGHEFDWASYRGKVVLVDFWASWCGPCRREIPNMKENLAKYSAKGFDIVGVNLDTTRKKYEGYVEKEELTWTNILSDKKGETGWDNPLASHYGISGIPTAILVDKEGKVVSLRARGSKLNTLLAELLGDADVDPEKEPADD